MEIENRQGDGNLSWVIRNIEGDMGEKTRLDLLLQADGDVIIALLDIEKGRRLSMEFCSSGGGGRDPRIAAKLREIIFMLAGETQ